MNPLADLLGESPGIAAVKEKLQRLLQRPGEGRRLPPVLIQGETGTGKGLLARAIHRASPRQEGPFVDVNCAAIPETLLESEMFGFERGAFTDARQAKAGLLQAAHRGTIFLDEVGLLPEALQAKLLKAIEEQAVRRLGSTRTEPVDVWILTATSEDLAAAARERRFREDLYHRLAVLTVWLPPLREREQDVVLLAEHFLARACRDYQLPPKRLDEGGRAALTGYRWPGNIRELSNVMERVALLSEGPVVTADVLGLPAVTPAREAPREEARPLEEAVGSVEREHLLRALQQTDWNISRAAALLGITRNTLRYRIEKHALRLGVSTRLSRRRVERPPVPEPAAVAPPEPAAPLSVRWEQRRLTLLRADLVPPRRERPALDSSRHLDVIVDKVQSFGGRVEELSPTGLVAVFGLEPVEDAPRRAALVAMAIQKAVEPDRPEAEERFTAKVGIHTGQFMVGRLGGTVEIDHEAKREAGKVLEGLVGEAAPGAVVVSDAAAPFLERRFGLAPAGLPGAEEDRAYLLAGRERAGLGPGGRVTRFVGRREELEVLRRRLASATSGHGQVVGIVGDAGIGKSRLLFEFRQSLAAEPVTYLEGRCFSYGSTVPYLPVIEMLRNSCRLAETDPPETIAEKVRGNLESIGMDAAEVVPFLLHLLGIKEGAERLAVLSPEAIKSRTFEILWDMALKGSRRRPLILAVEDLHWIDTASETYFATLVEGLAGAPILLLATFRPGYRPPGMEKSYATQIALQPLSPQDSLSVVHSVLETEELPNPVAQVILAKAEGNPFFLEELARAFGEQGGRPPAAAPETIQEVLLARIDRLPDEARQLLQTASVLGREFSLRLLRAIGDGPDAVDPHLRELMRLEFLYEQSGAEEPVYVFKHALTQEVAYESLATPRRRALHAAAGRALEILYGDRLEEASDRLAHHYAKTDNADKAVLYLMRFAEKAARAYAHVEAVAALRQAAAHVERLEPGLDRDRRLLQVVIRQAHSLNSLGRYEETEALFVAHRERVERVREPTLAGPYYFWLGRTYSVMGDSERAIANARRALEEATRCSDEVTLGEAYYALAQESFWSGQPVEGVEQGRLAVAHLERTAERGWLGQAHLAVAMNYFQLGEFEPALEATARIQAIGETIGDLRLQAIAAWVSGGIYAAMGEREKGIRACQRGLERSPDPVNKALAAGFLGGALLENGDFAAAIPLLEQAARQLGQFRVRHTHGWFTALLAEAHLLSGGVDRARELAHEGLRITQEGKNAYGIAWAQRALGRIAGAGGEGAEAEARLGEACRTFASIHARFELGRTHLLLADLAHQQGKPEGVSAHLKEAQSLFTALRLPAWVEQVARRARELGAGV